MSRLENSDISHKMDVAGDAGDIDAGDTACGGTVMISSNLPSLVLQIIFEYLGARDRLNFGLVNTAHWNVFLSIKSWAFGEIKAKNIISFSEKIRNVKKLRAGFFMDGGDGVSVNSSLKVFSAKHPELTYVKLYLGAQGSDQRKVLEIFLSCPNLTVFDLYTSEEITEISLPSSNSKLKKIVCTGLSISDDCMVKIVERCSETLEHLDLNVRKTDKTLKYVAEHCPNLTTLYDNFYEFKDDVVSGLLANCPKLKDIIVGNIQALTRKGSAELAQLFGRMRSIEVETESIPPEVTSQLFTLCSQLEHLNIQCELNRGEIVNIIMLNPRLKSLDVKFDDLGHSETDYAAANLLKALTVNCPNIETLKLKLSDSSLHCEDIEFEVATPCLKLKEVVIYHYSRLSSRGIKLLSRCAPNLEDLDVMPSMVENAADWAGFFLTIKEFKFLKTLYFLGLEDPSEFIQVQDSVCSNLEYLKLDSSWLSPEVMKAILLKCPRLNKLEMYLSYDFDEDVLSSIVEYGSSLKCLIIDEDNQDVFKLDAELVELGGLKSLVELSIPPCCKLLKKILIRKLPNLTKYNHATVERHSI